jgi:hypothetical protein
MTKIIKEDIFFTKLHGRVPPARKIPRKGRALHYKSGNAQTHALRAFRCDP